MDSTTFVSIIIPTLNEERYLNQCLDSVFEQSYPTDCMEVFVVDGQSTDSSPDIVLNYMENYPNLHLVDNPKRYQSVAFNLGVEKSAGDVIIRLDAHTDYHREYIARCVEQLKSGGYGNVGGRWLIRPGSDTVMGKSIAIMNSSSFVIGGADFRVGTEKKLVDTVPFGAFPREVVAHIGGMDEGLIRGEDNEYNGRIRAAGFKILFDPEIISYYVSRPNLPSFLSQMYSNGKSIGILLNQSPFSLSLRHLVPLLFFLFLIAGSIMSFFYYPARLIFFPVLGLYFFANIFFSLKSARKALLKAFPHIVVATFLTHLMYGVGTVVGIFRGKY